MNLTRNAVNRPIFTIMIVLIVIILGGVSLSRLPIDLMPDITSPTISISTSYSKASPIIMEELVTRPIEEAVSAVPGVQEISSQSSEGNSNVQVTFNWGTNLDTAANDLRDRLDRIIAKLPDDAGRPSLRKFDMSATPVINLGVTSQMDPVALRNLIDEQVSYRIERVGGVAGVDIRGGLEREIHINIDAKKIQSLNLNLDQVISKIQSANIDVPIGEIYRGNYQISVRVPGVYENLDQLANTIILNRNGANVKVKDIAEVEDGSTKETRLIRINGQPGVQISINKQSGTNTVKVVKGILKEIDNINKSIPSVKIVPLIDTSVYIKQSINNVTRSALEGAILAVLILLLFLRNIKSTSVITTAIPISVIATFGLLYFNGFTLNLMTLGGLALGVGTLLDNSIVVLENIFRHRELGKDSIEAAVVGTEEVIPPIIASTLTSLVVFLPIIFMRGMSGIMFQQLAFVIVFSMICALFTAITLVPMLASRLLTVSKDSEDHLKGFRKKIFHQTGLFLQILEEKYLKILHYALNHRMKISFIAGILLIGSIALIPLIGNELMPQSDEGEIRVNLDMEAGTRIELVDKNIRTIENKISKKIPEIKNIITTVGGSGWGGNASNTGQLRISLLSKSQRKRTDEEISVEIRKLIKDIPGSKIRVRTASNNAMTRVLGGSGGRIEIQIRGHNQEQAVVIANSLMKKLEDIPGIADLNLSRSIGAPEDQIQIDRAKAGDLGVSVEQVSKMLETVLSGSNAGSYKEKGKEFSVLVRVKDTDKMTLDEILNLNIYNSAGNPVILKNIVQIKQSESSTQIERINKERMIDISANINDRSYNAVMKDVQKKLDSFPAPIGFTVELSGDYKEQQTAFKELMIGFILSIILIFAVMASQYESLKDPFIVMFSVPLAVIGVVLVLFLTNTTFNIQSYIGCIMLGGIVVNNAILLVDTINLIRRKEGKPVYEAIVEAGRRRLRPIMMTALTTILGMLPMATGLGEGGEAQAPLARAVVGGLFSSTLITLVLIPVVYSFFEEKRKSPFKTAKKY